MQKGKIDKEKMALIIRDLDNYMKEMAENIDLKNLDDVKEFRAASMILFQIINRVINLGEEIIFGKKYRTPSTLKDIFFILGQEKFIRRELADELKKLVEYRNMLSHEYGKATEKDIITINKKLIFVNEFIKRVKKEL